MIRKGFRILGVKILDGCGSCAHKVLRPDTYYPFCEDYVENRENPYLLIKRRETTEVEANLYDIGDISIQINAIVGKNGDGKSSIIEIILRILNNFAYCYGYRDGQDSLQYNISVGAILFYEIDDHVYSLCCPRGDSDRSDDGTRCRMDWYKDGVCISDDFPVEATDKIKKEWLKANHADDLFYGMVVNYSIYSYNSKILRAENNGYGSWIDALFHKNDAYQTPVVLNPMRIDGNIDINREESLSHQRLMSIYTQNADDAKTLTWSADRRVLGFSFSMESDTKLLTKTIGDYFVRNHWKEYETKEVNENAFIHFLEFWESIETIWDESQTLINRATTFVFQSPLSRTNKTDLNQMMQKLLDVQMENTRFAEKKTVCPLFIHGTLSVLNFAELYRVVLVMMVWKCLRESSYKDVIDCTINQALSKSAEPRYAAKLYICYKIIEILNTYLPYYRQSYISDESFELFCNPIDKNLSFKRLKADIDEILKKKDYTTLKLRQCANYLRYQTDDYFHAEANIINNDLYLVRFEHLKSLLEEESKRSGINEIISLLPPPIFVGGILVTSNDDKQNYKLNELSSGEQQRLNSVGVLLYHLRNLDNSQTDVDKMQYRNVWVVFEEVELYFHPEYQKSFVAYLLDQIGRMRLQNINRINITFVSHSPFILTDILRNNILFLSEGHVKQVESETFAGNLYDLMHESFFLLDNAMGDFAARYISDLVKMKNDGGSIELEASDFVGDAILKNYLQS